MGLVTLFLLFLLLLLLLLFVVLFLSQLFLCLLIYLSFKNCCGCGAGCGCGCCGCGCRRRRRLPSKGRVGLKKKRVGSASPRNASYATCTPALFFSIVWIDFDGVICYCCCLLLLMFVSLGFL